MILLEITAMWHLINILIFCSVFAIMGVIMHNIKKCNKCKKRNYKCKCKCEDNKCCK